MRIVNDQQVGTLTRHSAAHADSEVFPALVSGPASSSLRIGLKPYSGEHLLVIRAAHKVSHLTTKAHGQFSSVGRLNHFLPGVFAQKPCWQEVGCEFRFGMSRGHVDDEALERAIGHSLESFAHYLVMATVNEPRPHLFHEGEIMLPRCLNALRFI